MLTPDAMQRISPRRHERREHWAAHSAATRPDLLPWDLDLPWHEASQTPEQLGSLLGEAVTFHQYANLETRYTISPTRAQAFALMECAGLLVVPHALVRDAPPQWEQVVVYLTEYGGHVGQDKALMTLSDAQAQYPDRLCSQYLVPEGPNRGVSERDFLCGNVLTRAELRSDDWRSNVNCRSVTWTDSEARPPEGPYGTENDALLGPLFAIDFVHQGAQRYAVDFNICAGITGHHGEFLGMSVMEAAQQWRGWAPLAKACTRTR